MCNLALHLLVSLVSLSPSLSKPQISSHLSLPVGPLPSHPPPPYLAFRLDSRSAPTGPSHVDHHTSTSPSLPSDQTTRLTSRFDLRYFTFQRSSSCSYPTNSLCKMKLSSMILSFALLAVLGLVNSLSVDFPASAKGDGYWVANATNTLNWRANASDPEYFSVQLLNSNSSSLNGNFQIANAISTANGSAQIFIDNIPSGSYTLLLVNASKYSLNKPQVFSTSLPFQLKPKGTEKANANPYATAYSHDGSSSTTTTNANGQTVNNDALDSANAAGNGTSSNSNAHQDAALHQAPAIRASVLIALVATGVALLA
ncbi:hypothetical protein IE81DRAFT_325583 [Ceraceosorus guamensis]|uniref:Yeast cell wall synthesis Kre9/Knh1-like N-terminal domain-containing protein n=1 Tax=Ceraceosorus guamensis TaxID=1522189 RepID=A0A316VT65_9BASI|nr:hypothetical protein IE81DRAFT_325583 [Ceraceosorus guamensis]PWN40414.1 hypothetical protein IE81DRAFT_325583 [Ceraceosorus guamensis]